MENLKNKRTIIGLILVLVIGIPFTIILALNQQETRSRADNEAAALELNPQSATKNLGETVSVDLNINAGNFSLTGIDTGININRTYFDFESFSPSSSFDTVINNSYSPSSGILKITLVNTQNLTSTGVIKIGTLNLKAKKAGRATIAFKGKLQVVGVGKTTAIPVTTTNAIYTIVSTPVGAQDEASCTDIKGWACDPDNYNKALKIQIFDGKSDSGGTLIKTITASSPRESAVGDMCGGNLNHGFVYRVPNRLKDGQPHDIYVYAKSIVGNNYSLLSDSPKSITCSDTNTRQTGTNPTTTPTDTSQ
jgi:hypothetical protein